MSKSMNAILDTVTRLEAALDGSPSPATAKLVAAASTTGAQAQKVKTFDAIVADLTAASAAFKALRDSKNGEADDHANTVFQHTELQNAALSVATQADSAAKSIDLILVPLNAAAQPTTAAPAAASAPAAA